MKDYLKYYRHSGLILNVKEEGLEAAILKILKELEIDNFFFLDQTLPYMLTLLNSGESRTSHKYSNIESIENLHLIQPKPQWVWVDSWNGDWGHLQSLKDIKLLGYKVCICSPEVHGRNSELELVKLHEIVRNELINVDAVCSKYPEKWVL